MTDEKETEAMAEIAKRLEAEGLAAEAQAQEMPILRDEAGLTEAGKAMPHDPTFGGWAPGGPSPGMSEIAAEARARDYVLFPHQPETVALPLSDLRERLAMLKEAGVLRYRDAGVEIQFDPESKRNPEPPLDGRSVERF